MHKIWSFEQCFGDKEGEVSEFADADILSAVRCVSKKAAEAEADEFFLLRAQGGAFLKPEMFLCVALPDLPVPHTPPPILISLQL